MPDGLREIAWFGMVGEHQNLCRLLDAFYEGQKVHLVFEHAGQSLRKFLKGQKKLTQTEVRQLGCEISSGLQKVHGSGVAHGDLSSNNVLVAKTSDTLKATICDFGSAVAISCREAYDPETVRKHGLRQTTLAYRAPEVLWGDTAWGTAADIWAWGCLFAEMLTGERLFSMQFQCPVHMAMLVLNLLGSDSAKALQGLPLFPKPLPQVSPRGLPMQVLERGGQQGRALLSGALQIDPGLRMTAAGISDCVRKANELTHLAHPWSFVEGFLDPELLARILEDDFFANPASSISELNLSWDMAARKTDEQNLNLRQKTQKQKLHVAGCLSGNCKASFLNDMVIEFESPVPCESILRLAKAWKAVNEPALRQLDIEMGKALKASLSNSTENNENASAEWCAAAGAIQFHRTEGSDGFWEGWEEYPNNDWGASASLIQIGVTLAGVRKLTLFASNPEDRFFERTSREGALPYLELLPVVLSSKNTGWGSSWVLRALPSCSAYSRAHGNSFSLPPNKL